VRKILDTTSSTTASQDLHSHNLLWLMKLRNTMANIFLAGSDYFRLKKKEDPAVAKGSSILARKHHLFFKCQSGFAVFVELLIRLRFVGFDIDKTFHRQTCHSLTMTHFYFLAVFFLVVFFFATFFFATFFFATFFFAMCITSFPK
jgi:hypothetical protein